MIEILLLVYVSVGISSLFVSFLRSGIWAFPLLPFLFIYNLFWGDAKRKAEARIVIKTALVLTVLFAILYFITFLSFGSHLW